MEPPPLPVHRPKYLIISDLTLISQAFIDDLKDNGYTLIETHSPKYKELLHGIFNKSTKDA